MVGGLDIRRIYVMFIVGIRWGGVVLMWLLWVEFVWMVRFGEGVLEVVWVVVVL